MRCPSRSASRSSSSAVSAVRHWAGRWIPHARLQHGRVLPDTFPWWGLLPWVTLVFTVAALGTVGAARRTAFPPERREERGIPGRVALLPRA